MFEIKFSGKSSGLSMEDVFGDQPFNFTCPGCQHKFTVKFKEVMVEGNQLTCPGCNKTIEIKHDDETKKSLKKGEAILKDLEDAINNFGK